APVARQYSRTAEFNFSDRRRTALTFCEKQPVGRPTALIQSAIAEEERMKRFLGVFALASALALAAPAAAQVQTGSILIRAIDPQGAVMPGVTITIASPVLVSGTMTAVTDAGGAYRFPSLVPGTYNIKIELSGFQTINREGIVVLVGQTTPVEFAMKVASLAENVTVTGASPTVDTTSANVNVN